MFARYLASCVLTLVCAAAVCAAPPAQPAPIPGWDHVLRCSEKVAMTGTLEFRADGARKVAYLTNIKGRFFVRRPQLSGPNLGVVYTPPEYDLVTEARLDCTHDLAAELPASAGATCNVSGTWGIFDQPSHLKYSPGLNVRKIDGGARHDEGEPDAQLIATATQKVTEFVLAQDGHRIAGLLKPAYLGHSQVRMHVPEVFGGCGTPSGMWYFYDGTNGVVTPFDKIQ